MERETMRKIREVYSVGSEVTPTKLRSLGIPSSTSSTFLAKHPEHFERIGKVGDGTYRLLEKRDW